jgi:hypothetical protein
MPCNCVLDHPTYPQNNEWGSLVWWILHTCAEKSGLQSHSMLQADEGRAWPLVVKTLVPMIPCPFCRDHAAEYLISNPFVLPAEYAAWNSYIRKWFWLFHESINKRLEKNSFPYDLLSSTYKDTNAFQTTLKHFDTIQMRAIKMNGITLLSWHTWVKHIRMLRAALCF